MHKRSYILVLFWFVASAVIVLKSSLSTSGSLTTDSCFYLGLAQNLIDGEGFYIASYTGEGERVWFSLWPFGYPVLIYGIAYLTGLTVFWASKILNIILFGSALIIVKFLFRERAHIYGAVLLFTPFLEIFSHTWSETLFIVSILWLGYASVSFDSGSNRFASVQLVFASVLLFLSRYIGAFAIVILSIGAIYYLIQKDYRRFVRLSGIIIIVSVFILIYLYMNISLSGYTTGMERIPAPESFNELVVMTAIAYVNEFNFLQGAIYYPDILQLRYIRLLKLVFFIIQIIVFSYVIVKFGMLRMKRVPIDKTALLLVLIGFVYWISITAFRWNFYFDRLSFRLLAPGTLMVLFGLIVYLGKAYDDTGRAVMQRIIYIIALLSVVVHLAMILPYGIQKERPSYHHTINQLQNLYGHIPEGSVVIFPNYNSVYLRPDIIKAFPVSYPREPEEWSHFISRILVNYLDREIYVQIHNSSFRPDIYHPSITDFFREYSHLDFYKVENTPNHRNW
jgi:hypothetical protein